MPPVIFAGGRFVLPFTILPSLVRFAYFGYNVTNTKEVKVEVTGGGAGGSVAKGASSNVADTKFRGQLAEDGKSPVMTWSLGNVYDGDDNAISYKSFLDVIHRTTVGQIDRVVDVPALAKGTFIPTAFAGWTTSVENVREDFQVLVEYELTYREVHLKNEGVDIGHGLNSLA